MKSIHLLKKLVFNGMLFENNLDELEKQGISARSGAKQETIIRIEEGSFSPRIMFQGNRMASIYTVFFCLENSVRELIQARLLERVGIDWWEKCVPLKIKKAAQKLKDKEEKNKYHASRNSSFIYYTMFGELGQIIISQWEHFSDLFGDQHWISARFNDLELSRNIIMHSGVLPELEIERIESISRDWIRQVG